jgi:hypothetical protein
MIPDTNAVLGEMKGTHSLHTGYRAYGPRVLPASEEDNVPLALIDIMVLQKEELVNAVLLECAELDE